MQYFILPAETAVKMDIPNSTYAVMIRALEPRSKAEDLLYADKYADILELYYDDMTEDDFSDMNLLGSNFKLFSDDDAMRLVDFFKKHQNADMFVFHCHAGKSRSAAMAIGFSRFLKNGKMEQEIRTSKRKFIPNPTVLEKIIKQLT